MGYEFPENQCEADCPPDCDRHICTREYGHPGDHVARHGDGNICCEWTQSDDLIWTEPDDDDD